MTIYHRDMEGPATHWMQRSMWALMHALALRWPKARRTLLSFAGPLMMLATFTLWVGLFIFGFTFIVWPNLDAYRAEQELGGLTFIDALYYTGVTGTVLGYGDISPLTGPMKILTVVISGSGFLLLTGGVTYLIGVVNGASARNTLALRVRAATRRTGDGVRMAQEMLVHQEVSDVRERLDDFSASMRDVQERFNQYPIIDLFYRSRLPSRDPEPMLVALAQASVALRLVARQHRRILPEALELSEAVTDIMLLVSSHLMPKKVHEGMRDPRPAPQDVERLQHVQKRLDDSLGGDHDPGDEGHELRVLVARTRVFADELDRITTWRSVSRP